MMRKQSSLTEGSIWKGMLLFALPIFLGNVFQQFYNAFDSWVVGRFLGDTALAAVSSSGSLIFMMIGFFNGVAMGAGVVIARCYGARDYTSMSRAIHTDIAMGLAAGALLTVLGVSFTPTILRWMGTPENVLPQSVSYFRYYFFGALFSVMYNIFVGILHALGDSKHPLYYLIFSTAVNMVLDLVFVGVFHWGVGAAALATTLSQGISALLCCIHLLRMDGPGKMRVHSRTLRTILRMGLPSGVQNSVIALANLVVQSSINSFGSAAMAGCGSYSKLEGFAFLPVTCFAMALSTFVGQNLGAGNYSRVKKGVAFGIACSTIAAECIGIVSYLFAPQLIGIFNNSPQVVDYGARHMRIICLFYCLLAFSHCIAGIMRGAGDTVSPMWISLFTTVGLRLPLAYGLAYLTRCPEYPNGRPEALFGSMLITWTLGMVIHYVVYRVGPWKKNLPMESNERSHS